MLDRFIATPFFASFLGGAPNWYKFTILGFLIFNPPFMLLAGDFWVGYLLLLQFIFTLMMTLYCYPLQAGGLLALQAMFLGLATPEAVYEEIRTNLAVFLLLMYMVAGIYFMKELLLVTFSKILLGVRNRVLMNTLLLFTSAVLSAFLDALTVLAVLISVTAGFYRACQLEQNRDLVRRYLAGMVMHGAVGTALGGVCTLVGEPQNLLIAQMAEWDFVEFAVRMAPVTVPCFIVGVITCVVLEYFALDYYGNDLTDEARQEVAANLAAEQPTDPRELTMYRTLLWVQGVCAVLLCIGLLFHLAEVGLIGLGILVLLTAFGGKVRESELGPAFHEAMPFTALLACFFVIVAVIHAQHLFSPVSAWVYSFPAESQPTVLFAAAGLLSIVSDNVFVATIYMSEIKVALDNALLSREQFNALAVAINTGTNLPSVATPNGQAAFLFLLTSPLAPRLGLSYLRMVLMAAPYAVVLSVTGFIAVFLWI